MPWKLLKAQASFKGSANNIICQGKKKEKKIVILTETVKS